MSGPAPGADGRKAGAMLALFSGTTLYPPMTDLVVTIVAASGAALDRGTVAAVADALAAAVGAPGRPDWLDPGRACDVTVPGAASMAVAAEAAARRALAGRTADAIAQPAAGRRKALLVADMEATVIENELIDDLGREVGRLGEVAAVTRQAMNGEIPFAEALAARARLFAGLGADALDRVAAGIRPMPGAATLVRTMRRDGARTVLVSGGFGVFVRRVHRLLGFDDAFGNELEMAEGRLTGRLARLDITAEGKRDALLQSAAEAGLAAEAVLAVGDGANDVPMLLAAGLGVAFRPKPAVALAVPRRLEHADLTALLHAQGYRRRDFADPP